MSWNWETSTPDPSDIFIAVVGISGSGKSTFIASCAGEDVEISHGLWSCTNEVDMFSFQRGGRTVHLIDTPGFDDSVVSDATLLEVVADWLYRAYICGVKLHGLIYLHPITSNRMQGSALKSLRIFQRICGGSVFHAVTLGSTMWDKIDPQIGQLREVELTSTPDFWGDMVAAGSWTFRFQGDQSTALLVCDHLIRQEHQVTLALQDQLFRQRMLLYETDAGREVAGELVRLKEFCTEQIKTALAEAKTALESYNQQMVMEASAMADRYQAQLGASLSALETLGDDMETIHERREMAIEVMIGEWEREQEQNELVISQKRDTLEKAQQDMGSSDGIEKHQQQVHELERLVQKQNKRGKKIFRYSKRMGRVKWGTTAGLLGVGLQAASLGVAAAGFCNIM